MYLCSVDSYLQLTDRYMKEYNKQLALELQDKYNLPASYIEEWEKENQIPFFFSQNRAIEKSDARVQKVMHIHSHQAVNSSKLAHKKSFIWNVKQPIQKRVSEIEVELELIRIKKLRNFISDFLKLDIENSDSYKKEFEKVLFDTRIMYSKITPKSSYSTYRKRWKAGNFDKIDIEMLHTERNALQKLYDELFPAITKKFSISVALFGSQTSIDLGAEAKTREEAFKILQRLLSNVELPFTANDLVESSSTYNRNEGVQDTFDYLPDVDENDNNIETDPTKFV